MPLHNNKRKKAAAVDSRTLNLILVIIASIILLVAMTVVYLIVANVTGSSSVGDADKDSEPVSSTYSYPFKTDISVTVPDADDSTVIISSDTISSKHAMLIDITNGKVIASRQSSAVIYPASMTKVMSLIIIAENLKSEESLSEQITITQELVDRKIKEEHSGDLHTPGEVLTVEDLIYAFALKSDGMAGIALAEYIAGSEYSFVELMNTKVKELGLKNTNFINCTGIHHEYHYTTCHDMAAIMMYAMKNPFCAKVLSTKSYRTETNVYTSGITFYNGVLVDQIERKNITFKTVDVSAGKTGWTGKESGACIVSYAKGKSGHQYVLVTANAYAADEASPYASSMLKAANDMKTIYDAYAQ